MSAATGSDGASAYVRVHVPIADGTLVLDHDPNTGRYLTRHESIATKLWRFLVDELERTDVNPPAPLGSFWIVDVPRTTGVPA